MPRHAFILWLAIMAKLKTRDKLRIIPPDFLCVFCRQEEQTRNHLFFACHWTSLLWGTIKTWLRITRSMSTLNSDLKGLTTRKQALEARMKRVSLGIVVYLIWEEKNKRIFDNSCHLGDVIFRNSK